MTKNTKIINIVLQLRATHRHFIKIWYHNACYSQEKKYYINDLYNIKKVIKS